MIHDFLPIQFDCKTLQCNEQPEFNKQSRKGNIHLYKPLIQTLKSHYKISIVSKGICLEKFQTLIGKAGILCQTNHF